ncbi:hypothetical protein SK128_017354, partial [Halocaridina rubra]
EGSSPSHTSAQSPLYPNPLTSFPAGFCTGIPYSVRHTGSLNPYSSMQFNMPYHSGKPQVLLSPPPLMSPCMPLYAYTTPQPGLNFIYPAGYEVVYNKKKSDKLNSTSCPTSPTHKIQQSPCKSPNSPLRTSPMKRISQEYHVKPYKFSWEVGQSSTLKKGEIFIRGAVSYDSLDSVAYISNGSSLKVEIPRETLYVLGRKMEESEKLASVLTVGSTVKALVKRKVLEDKTKEGENESNATYTAVIAWYGEIPDTQDLIPVISELEDSEVYQDINMKFDIGNEIEERKSNDNDVPRENLTNVFAQFHGYVWWANEKEGIVSIYEERDLESCFSGIIFDINSVLIEGRKAHCDSLHYLVAHFDECYVNAHNIIPKNVHGMLIKWEAITIEFGAMPLSVSGNCLHQWLSSEFSHDEQNIIKKPSTEAAPESANKKSSKAYAFNPFLANPSSLMSPYMPFYAYTIPHPRWNSIIILAVK